jgi:hypothetical protein
MNSIATSPDYSPAFDAASAAARAGAPASSVTAVPLTTARRGRLSVI